MIYDCAIIGAGPAGSTCARYLAEKGCSVLLLDRHEFPRDKPCGGGFSYNLLDEFPYLKKHEQDIIEEICKVGVIHSPNRRVMLRGNVEMAVTRRTVFDNALVEEAIAAGTELTFRTRAKAVDINHDGATIKLSPGNTVKSRVVVGADGINSVTARTTGLHRKWAHNAVTPCRVAEIPMAANQIDSIYGSEREYHFYANLEGRPGYAWVFPKRSTVNIGLGVVATHASGLRSQFNRFVRYLVSQGMVGSAPNLSGAKGALVPTGGTLERTYTDRCILIGDSAGFVNPITGGGISYAMHAARYGAQVICNALESNDLSADMLSEYQDLWWKDFGRSMNQMVKIQKILTSPYTDLLFEIGKRDEKIQEIVALSMAESKDSAPDAKRLVARILWVCLREALTC